MAPRRLIIALVAWLGLVWAASPALACEQMSVRDCCPAGTHTPCDNGSRDDVKLIAAACCATTPATASAMTAESFRSAYLQPQDSGSPDPVALIAWFATLASPTYEVPPAPPDPIAARSDARPTYLRTLRLRL